MSQNQPKLSTQILQWVVFGLMISFGFFLLFGLIIPSAYGCWKTRSETIVSAKLTSLEKRLSSGSRGMRSSTVANYTYEFEGLTYTSDRVSIWGQSGDFFYSLDKSWRNGKRIKVFIDPNDPSYAVYDREFSAGPITLALVMALATAGMGFHGLWWCHKNRKGKKRKRTANRRSAFQG